MQHSQQIPTITPAQSAFLSYIRQTGADSLYWHLHRTIGESMVTESPNEEAPADLRSAWHFLVEMLGHLHKISVEQIETGSTNEN